MPLKTGQVAPDFTLYDTEKNKVQLQDFKEKKHVVLLFFPLAFTRVCTAELCAIRDDIGRFSNNQVQVLGISVDSVYCLAKYKQEQQFNFPLLSDFNREVSEMYECLYHSFSAMEMKAVSKRSVFVIDSTGTLRYSEVQENAGDLPNFNALDQILAVL